MHIAPHIVFVLFLILQVVVVDEASGEVVERHHPILFRLVAYFITHIGHHLILGNSTSLCICCYLYMAPCKFL